MASSSKPWLATALGMSCARSPACGNLPKRRFVAIFQAVAAWQCCDLARLPQLGTIWSFRVVGAKASCRRSSSKLGKVTRVAGRWNSRGPLRPRCGNTPWPKGATLLSSARRGWRDGAVAAPLGRCRVRRRPYSCRCPTSAAGSNLRRSAPRRLAAGFFRASCGRVKAPRSALKWKPSISRLMFGGKRSPSWPVATGSDRRKVPHRRAGAKCSVRTSAKLAAAY